MNLFVIHRSPDRRKARALLKDTQKRLSAPLRPVFLDSTRCEDWKDRAVAAISDAEIVIVFNRQACDDSENAKWEIERAEEAQMTIVDLSVEDNSCDAYGKLKPLYDLKEEFDGCFKADLNRESALELYKIMIDSSEKLMQRRQSTSAFFITVIGSLLAIAGFMAKSEALCSGSVWLLYGFSITGMLLCNSWRNLLDNYGKLNKAKFDVILRLEKTLAAEIYSAEWVALGKGLRPKKYRSFTNTEQNVPTYFCLLIFALTMFAVGWQIWTGLTTN